MMLHIYLKTLSSEDLTKQVYGMFRIIWTCTPDEMPSFKMAKADNNGNTIVIKAFTQNII